MHNVYVLKNAGNGIHVLLTDNSTCFRLNVSFPHLLSFIFILISIICILQLKSHHYYYYFILSKEMKSCCIRNCFIS